MTDAELDEIARRAEHLAHFRRLAKLGEWSFVGDALRSGGILIASLPMRSAGDQRRARFYGQLLLELLTGTPEEDNRLLVAELKRLRVERDEACGPRLAELAV